MRIFTSIAFVSAVAISAGAATAPLSHSKLGGKQVRAERTIRNKSDIKLSEISKNADLKKRARKASPVKKVNGPSDTDEILSIPLYEGVPYVKTGGGYAMNYVWVMDSPVDGAVSQILFKGDKFFLSNPVGTYNVVGAVEGSVADNVVTLSLPQRVEDVDNYDGSVLSIYCVAMEYADDEEGGWFYASDSQDYKLSLNADGTITPATPDVYLGLCTWNPEDNIWEWAGMLDMVEEYNKLTAEVASVPDDVVFEDWTMIADKNGTPLSVGFSGDNVYVKGILSGEGTGDSSVVGTIEGDKVTFAKGQYLGVEPTIARTTYFVPGKFEEIYDEEYDEYYDDFIAADAMVATINAEHKKIVSENSFIVSVAPESLLYMTSGTTPVFVKYDPEAKASKLNNPELDVFYAEEPENGYPAECAFYISNVSADDVLLNTSNLYFNVYIDDELYTFMDDEYSGFTGEMTDVPYGFNSEEFMTDGSLHDFVIWMSDIESLAIQVLYKQCDEILKSDLVYMYGENGVSSVSDSETVSRTYFDLAGRRISMPASGLYISVNRKADGSVKAEKVMLK